MRARSFELIILLTGQVAVVCNWGQMNGGVGHNVLSLGTSVLSDRS